MFHRNVFCVFIFYSQSGMARCVRAPRCGRSTRATSAAGAMAREPAAAGVSRESHPRRVGLRAHEGRRSRARSRRRSARSPHTPRQRSPPSAAGPPPPAGRARRSAGRRPGRVVSCRVVWSRAASSRPAPR